MPSPSVRTVIGSILGVMMISGCCHGEMVLTSFALQQDFKLTTYASGFPPGGGNPQTGAGPFGIAYRTDGDVLVASTTDMTLRLLPSHADGQGSGVIIQNYSSLGVPYALAQVQNGSGYNFYMGMGGLSRPNGAGALYQIDQQGNILDRNNPIATFQNGPAGLAVYPGLPGAPPGPLTGHILAPQGNNLWDINPAGPNPTQTLVYTGAYTLDGATFSPDGSKLYVAGYGANTVLVFNSANLMAPPTIIAGPAGGAGLDGISVGLGTLSPYIYANFNNGTFWQYGLAGSAFPGWNEIGYGGSRGDFVYMDPSPAEDSPGSSFPSLLLDQSDRILRLDPPGGGFYTSNGSSYSIPEPGGLILLTIGCVPALLYVRMGHQRKYWPSERQTGQYVE